jgi:hypothetical protein
MNSNFRILIATYLVCGTAVLAEGSRSSHALEQHSYNTLHNEGTKYACRNTEANRNSQKVSRECPRAGWNTDDDGYGQCRFSICGGQSLVHRKEVPNCSQDCSNRARDLETLTSSHVTVRYTSCLAKFRLEVEALSAHCPGCLQVNRSRIFIPFSIWKQENNTAFRV